MARAGAQDPGWERCDELANTSVDVCVSGEVASDLPARTALGWHQALGGLLHVCMVVVALLVAEQRSRGGNVNEVVEE